MSISQVKDEQTLTQAQGRKSANVSAAVRKSDAAMRRKSADIVETAMEMAVTTTTMAGAVAIRC